MLFSIPHLSRQFNPYSFTLPLRRAVSSIYLNFWLPITLTVLYHLEGESVLFDVSYSIYIKIET